MTQISKYKCNFCNGVLNVIGEPSYYDEHICNKCNCAWFFDDQSKIQYRLEYKNYTIMRCDDWTSIIENISEPNEKNTTFEYGIDINPANVDKMIINLIKTKIID